MTRGVITLVFDDGYEAVYNSVVPLLRHYRMPAVFALPLNSKKLEATEQRKIKPWQEWRHLRDEGHELAAHSVTHTNLTKLSDEALRTELKNPSITLQTRTLVYPGGAFDDRVVHSAARYYTAARTTQRGFETLPPQNPLKLKTFNFSRNNFSLLKANVFALWACITNSWLIETYHMIDENNREMIHTVHTHKFAQHLQFINNLPVNIQTIKDVMQAYS